MASENIVPPFRIDRDSDLTDNTGKVILIIDVWAFDNDSESKYKFARELCAVMNENANRLCHAANGKALITDDNQN